jgi:membrane protease YdiL (CAAX protease family)
MVVGILMSLQGKNISSLLPGQLGAGEMGYFLTGFLVQFLATVGLVYLFAVFLPRGQWKDLGICKARPGSYFRYGVIGGILLIIMVLVIGYGLKYLQPDLQPQYYEEMLRSATRIPDFLVILVVGSILAPLTEELFYRGMIYPVFRKHLGPMWGAIMAGLVFGLAHWDLWRTLPLALGGIGLCYIYEKSGSILVSVVAHGVWNGVISILIYLSLSRGML